MRNKHALLISIRPRFAEMIFSGRKTVELRRVRPKALKEGDLALVYVTSPTKELQGAFEVQKIISASPDALWKKLGAKTGVSRKEFDAYFVGKQIAHAILIKKAWKLDCPIQLSSLKRRSGGFQPPQSFHYIRNREFTVTPTTGNVGRN